MIGYERRLFRSALVWTMLLGCGSGPTPSGAAPVPLASPKSEPAASPTRPELAPVGSSPAPRGPAASSETCGELDCRLFDSPEAAFMAVLEEGPLVLAVGEAHAQKGSEAIESSTRRFTERLLPKLEGSSSDLIVELWAPDPKCLKKARKVAEKQKPVTAAQAESNQNEYVTLGVRARELAIVPHLLRPSCSEYDEIMRAGENDVSVMLSMIARLTSNMVKALLQRNARAGQEKMIIAYGGALHNDLLPREGREGFSFGPDLDGFTKHRYVELDLIVPEFIKDTESWRALAWYPHFDPRKHPKRTTLYKPSPRSYALIFPRSEPS